MQTLKRTAEILSCFSIKEPTLSLGEIAERTGIPKPTVYRICETLVKLGLLKKNLDKTYSLGYKLLELGSIVLSTLEIRKVAIEVMEKLQSITGESVHLGILDGTHVLSIEALESPQPLRTKVYIGKRAALYSTAIGKALLAFLPEDQKRRILEKVILEPHTRNTITDKKKLIEELRKTQERGYSVDNMEDEEGVRCVGAPILNNKGFAIASISVSGPASRITEGKIKEYAELVIKAAREISKKLGYTNY
ncbi:IclR family transcriptional regulator [Thermotoga sp.]|uniref:IclR family transcriptional regulator n=1 Tax=Thermotoga sp. TaxID=28240 RepID=UPI0025D85AF9|nr:IclR family transcriptional regulator [Thermotoga sp.]MCD6552351.1 IclR family transcriptional regulator [Thermotoga sp.]